MAVIFGEGEHRHEVIDYPGELPDGRPAVWRGMDSNDNVYVFSPGKHPMIVFDRAGTFQRSWEEGLFNRPRGIFAIAQKLGGFR